MSGYLTTFLFSALFSLLNSPDGLPPADPGDGGDGGNGSSAFLYVGNGWGFDNGLISPVIMPLDTPPPNPMFSPGDPTTRKDDNPFYTGTPSNISTSYELDEDGNFTIREKVGDIDIRPPSSISVDDYLKYRREQGIRDHFKDRAVGSNDILENGSLFSPSFAIPDALKNIFGDGKVEIRPNGTALIDIGAEFNRMRNPSLPIRQQKTANFRFDQQIQLNVVGNIGSKLRLNANWDTQATFDFENQMKLRFGGTEDEILQTVEAGNVSLPLNGSLISGGQNLFGVKVGMKFGPVLVTAIASQQKGKTQTVTATGGAQVTEFNKQGNEYDENRHFFLSHYFRSRYEYALDRLPNINSPMTITRVEVWVTNNNAASTTDNRNAVGFIDLGETPAAVNTGFPDQIGRLYNTRWTPRVTYPDNNANDLYFTISQDSAYSDKSQVVQRLADDFTLVDGADFQLVENMRKLRTNEYTFHPQLGYVSLNSQLQQNQVLFVAYEYILGNETYQVGDFTMDAGKQANQLNSNVLFLKMLKPQNNIPTLNNEPYPTWDLMMKNIYSIGGYGLRPDNFRLEIMYDSRTSVGTIGYLPTSVVADKPLLQVFNLDQLSNNDEGRPDNFFDFKEGITIMPDRGLVIFPVLEPFGSHLEGLLDGDEQEIEKYVFNELYDQTRQDAINYANVKDRFILQGSYQSASSSEISLNSINVAPGSVKVTANGITLTEGVDYQVDYNIGKVTILNTGILTSGQEINVTFETNSLFGIDTKSMLGVRMDYNVNKSLQLGATMLHLNERPLTNKVNIGDEPISNIIWGVDGVYRKESRFLTKLIDKLPLIQTKEISNVTFQGEFAQLVPGHPRAIRVKGLEDGIAYLDDFESARTTFDLTGWRSWTLASFPGDNGNNNMVTPSTGWNGALSPNFSRAKLAWYSIDPSFYFNSVSEEFPEEDLSNHYTRQVTPNEVFPQQTNLTGDNLQRTFDLHYIPSERGPYNYQVDPALLNADGTFNNPKDNWAGIQRRTSGNTDFEAANFEFIEFFMLDPFAYGNNEGGEFYLNLGQVSEDVIPDGARNFENGLPGDPNDSTKYETTEHGRRPLTTPPTIAFNNDAASREFQDVGLDGLRTADEQIHFQRFLDTVATLFGTTSGIYTGLQGDPSSDNYQYFRGPNWDGQGILARYEDFNNHDGNTPVNAVQDGFSSQGSPNPDTEDINANSTLNTTERYWEYQLNLKPGEMEVGKNFIVDVIPAPENIRLANGDLLDTKWYQFRIPLTAGFPINDIQNFKAIEFIRMYLKGWDDESILRFARFQLVSTSWRTFRDYLGPENDTLISDPLNTSFEIGTVNVEENGSRQPFNYILPPNIIRQNQVGSPQQGLLQNEQSLVVKACNLGDGDARGAFRLVNHDLRSYKRMKMWVHAENVPGSGQEWQAGDLRAFVRLGSDNTANYYEYEIPLTPSEPGNQDTLNIWANEFDFPLDRLSTAKAFRNEANYPLNSRFEFTDPETGNRIYVIGTPKFSEVKSMMVGIRNVNDAKGPVCAETWFNELRVTDFREEPGYAANARVNLKLADFGNITFSGSIRTEGFGALEQKINNRSRENIYQYDIAGNFNLGKFFPKNWGIQLPVYATYGERMVDPQFNPLESDVVMDDYLRVISTDPERRDSIRTSLQQHQRNRSISFNNVKKIRAPGGGRPGGKQKKPMPWDLENWTLNFSYNELEFSDHTTLRRLNTNHRAGIAYAFNIQSKPIRFFPKAKKQNLITAMNFNPLPRTFTVSMQGDRRYEENFLRPTANGRPIQPTVYKNFFITRDYSLRWDLMQSLSLNYTATNVSRVDEAFGARDSVSRDSLLSNLFTWGSLENPDSLKDSLGFYQLGKDKLINIGRNTRFNQSFGVNYIVPFDKVKFLNFINSTVTYQGTFSWQTAPDNNRSLGNTINNSRNLQANARVNLQNLYNKVGFIKKIMERPPPKRDDCDKGPTGRRKAGDEKPKPGEEGQPKEEEDDEEEEEKDPFFFIKGLGKEIVRTVLSVKNVDFTWGRNGNTSIAGYLPETDNFGLDFNYRDQNGNLLSPNMPPPGYGFMMGWQYDQQRQDWLRDVAAANGWITRDSTLATPFNQSWSEQWTGRTSVTLGREFKIDLNVTKNRQENYSEIFRYDDIVGDFVHNNQVLNGSYSVSYIFLNSAFEKNIDRSKSFVELEDNARRIISSRLASRNSDNVVNFLGARGASSEVNGYINGYNGNSQDVLVPAFLAAYGAPSAENVNLSPFPTIPLPNWRVNYNGLSKIYPFCRWFKQVTLKHGYRATFNVGGYTTNIDFEGDRVSNLASSAEVTGLVNGDSLYNFMSNYVIPTVGFTESFSPLIGINLNFENGITVTSDYKTNRTVSLSVGNLQLTETRSQDVTLSVAWRKDKLNGTIRLFGKDLKLENSLNTRLEVTIRDSKTRNRMLDSEVSPDFTGGNFMLIIKPTVDYVVNTKLNVRFYIEHSRNRPAISTSFPSSFTAAGFQVRFTLTN